jgi:hypothetical protein
MLRSFLLMPVRLLAKLTGCVVWMLILAGLFYLVTVVRPHP